MFFYGEPVSFEAHPVAIAAFSPTAGSLDNLEELNEHLAVLSSIHGQAAVEHACVILRLLTDLEHEHRPWQKFKDRRRLGQTYATLEEEVGGDAGDLLTKVELWLWHRHRASSAIEGFNAALRPHLYVHKGLTQRFLERLRRSKNATVRAYVASVGQKTRRFGRTSPP